jgi:hypothetical protein
VRRLARAVAVLAVLAARVVLAESDPVYTALRAARPQGQAIAVSNLTLERDVFRFRFDRGVFVLLAPVESRVLGAVFMGEGSWELRPGTEAERRQLAFETGDKSLEVLADRFTELTLLFTDGSAAEIVEAGRPGAAAPAQAADVWNDFLKRERKDLKTNLHIRLLADLLRPPDPARGVFMALVDGKKLKPAIAVVDPAGLDWMPEMLLVGAENSALYVVHESEGGYWYLARRKADAALPSFSRASARAEAYSVDTTIRKSTDIRGTTTIRWRPLEEGLRVLPLGLLDKLRIQEVVFARGDDPAWNPAAFIQERKDEDANVAIVFPAPLPKDELIRLKLTYEGTDVLRSAGDGNFIVGARESWYPNLGVFREPAAYELTFRIPKKNEIISVGEPVEDRIEGDSRICVWKTAAPIRVAGFNYGAGFKRLEQTDKDSGLRIQVFTNPGTPDIIHEIQLSGVAPERLADSAMADGINTSRVGTVYFGPLPGGHVAITQQSQWFFGQSWPSLIFLPYLSFLDSYNRFRLGLQETADFVDAVGPHEFAHQWWGHLVGWDTYRDQWLSEGLAEFTAGLVLEVSGGPKKAAEFWDNARKRIVEKPAHSFVANDEAGPITQGWRLYGWRSRSAAQAMIYSKGAYVIHMLRMLMRDPKGRPPDAAFIGMMKDFVASYSGKNPSTRDFQDVVERHMSPIMDLAHDGKMDWFFRQWVSGMVIPRYITKVSVQTAGGDQYRLTGSVSQEGVPADFRGFLPLYLEFDKGTVHRLGVVSLTGVQSVPVDTTLHLPLKPRRVIANALHDVLTRD